MVRADRNAPDRPGITQPAGAEVIITYDWKIRADKPLLRYLSFMMKPFFAANHRWAMRKGLESLRLELARRHAPSPEARALIPPPPGRTTTSSLPLTVGTLGTIGLVIIAARTLLRVMR
jgi:hypothetical protein